MRRVCPAGCSSWLRCCRLSSDQRGSGQHVNFGVAALDLPNGLEQSLAFGPPAQPLTDLLNSPVAGQFKLMNMDFRANTDLVVVGGR